jgi:hypothetical protein
VKDVENQIKVKPEGAGDREVTRSTERDSRAGSEGPETTSRKAGATASSTTTR